jgi:hypothetical protein
MTAFLHIVRKPYEEPYHLNLLVSASDGSQRGELEIYANAEDLGTFASKLRQMPGGKREAIWSSARKYPRIVPRSTFGSERIRSHRAGSAPSSFASTTTNRRRRARSRSFLFERCPRISTDSLSC